MPEVQDGGPQAAGDAGYPSQGDAVKHLSLSLLPGGARVLLVQGSFLRFHPAAGERDLPLNKDAMQHWGETHLPSPVAM